MLIWGSRSGVPPLVGPSIVVATRGAPGRYLVGPSIVVATRGAGVDMGS